MVEIMSAELVARESIKNILALEIPLVNKSILDAKSSGRTSCFIKERISNGTIRILENAGYDVETDYSNDTVEISWAIVYNNLMNSEEFIEEISQELNLKVIDIDSLGNTIDPNWKHPKEDD